MKYSEFKNSLESGKVFPVYLFEGEDSFFSGQGLNLLVDKFIQEKQLNYSELNLETLSTGEIIASLNALPFLSQKRMVVLREYFPKADEVKQLSKYFENPNDSSILVIINVKTSEGLKKLGDVCVVDCARMDASAIARWIKSECLKRGVEIELETSKTLAEFCLSDMVRVKTETQKLCDYVGNNGQITSSTIELLVSRDSDYKIYEMTDFIGKKQFDKALSVISEMLSRGETPQRILISVYNYFRRLLHTSISDKKDSEIASYFGIKEFAVKKLRQQAGMFKRRALKSAVDYLCDADYNFKSGKTTVEDEMWFSLFRIMQG